jgi:phage baseplate assembly protein W
MRRNGRQKCVRTSCGANSMKDREYGEKVLQMLDEKMSAAMKVVYENSDETIEKIKKLTSNQREDNE